MERSSSGSLRTLHTDYGSRGTKNGQPTPWRDGLRSKVVSFYDTPRVATCLAITIREITYGSDAIVE